MSDLISRSALLEVIEELFPLSCKLNGQDANVCHHAVQDAPAVDAVEVVPGRWIHDINNLYGCSECGERETMSHKKLKNYCPNCGAKMDLKENPDD